MSAKTYAIITDIHSNAISLEKALDLIRDNGSVDQLVCLGDCFSIGPDPKTTLDLLMGLDTCVFIRGNHDRYLIEKLWEEERPSLEGMDPDDPICQAIVANEKWTYDQLGPEGIEFVKKMNVSYRDTVGKTLVEFTHAWYQRDDLPPSMDEALHWRNHVSNAQPDIDSFVFVHGHVHTPRYEERGNLKLLCQGATGLPFDEDPRGAVAFLTVGDTFSWNVIRYEYDVQASMQVLEDFKPPFYKNLQNTLKYASIRNDI